MEKPTTTPPSRGITEATLARQEERFARAFSARDLEIARPLYHPEVVYQSPTVRLFDWPPLIEGVERTLEFIALTIRGCTVIEYRVVESALLDGGASAFVHVSFDWTAAERRLRSSYVVIYRYRDGLIARQELYYDPSGRLEELSRVTASRRPSMDRPQRWNHNNFAVPPERMAKVSECVDALFGWTKFVDKPHLLGYRLTNDLYEAAVYFRPVGPIAAIEAALAELRRERPEIERAFAELDDFAADYRDHCGFMVSSVEEWEERVARARRLAAERPDLAIEVVDVLRPGDGRAPTDDLYQAFIRVRLLGPLRNTFEMQARAPGAR